MGGVFIGTVYCVDVCVDSVRSSACGGHVL